MENLPSDLFLWGGGGGLGQRSIKPKQPGENTELNIYIYSQQLPFILNTFKCHNITHSWSALH